MQSESTATGESKNETPTTQDATDLHPVDWLRLEYARRRSKNPSYSLRAFARSLQIPSGPLSEILARKRPLSPRSARRIADRLGLSEEQAAGFIAALKDDAPTPTAPSARYRELEQDTFAVIAEWYHYALLSLMETSGFHEDPAWIARRLGIEEAQASTALGRLLRLGLAERVDGRCRPTGSFSTTHDVPFAALRQFHRSLMDRAIASLERVPVERRDVTSMTLAIDPKRLPEAKAHIKRFRRQMADLLEVGNRKEVYHLTIQLVPAAFEPGEDA